MKIVVDNEYIQKIIDAYERLGFEFHEDDLCNFIIGGKDLELYANYYNYVRVTYINEKHEEVTKMIGDLKITDINSAYIYSNDIAKSKKQRLINGEAFNNLVYISSRSETRTKINKMIVKHIIEKKYFDVIDNDVTPVVEEPVVKDNTKYEIQAVQPAEIVKQEKGEITKAPTTEIVKKDDRKQELRNTNTRSTEVRNSQINNAPRTKVVMVENDKQTADKARSIINKDSVLVTAGLIILASAIAFAAYSCNKTTDHSRAYVATEDTTDININNNNTNIVDTDNTNTNETIEEDEVEEETKPKKEEVVEETTVEEEVQEVTNVHSEEFINKVTDNTLTSIQLNGDSNITAKFDRSLVEALVRYTHHNYPEYTGENILSNEIAYEDMSELINHGFDISMFYEGLNNYDNLKALYNATRNLKQEKGQYEDEFKIYTCMDVIMNEMNTNNFPEAIALRAYVDNYSVIPSMQMARQQAGVLEMKDTQDLWRDVNKDGSITYEENAEGKGYNDEKAAAIAARYGEMSSEKCAQIYNRIKTDGNNSELTQIVYRAIEEDNTKVRTR